MKVAKPVECLFVQKVKKMEIYPVNRFHFIKMKNVSIKETAKILTSCFNASFVDHAHQSFSWQDWRHLVSMMKLNIFSIPFVQEMYKSELEKIRCPYNGHLSSLLSLSHSSSSNIRAYDSSAAMVQNAGAFVDRDGMPMEQFHIHYHHLNIHMDLLGVSLLEDN